MRPRVILSNAISLNGSLTGFAIDYGIYYPVLLSCNPDAVLVGADTVLAARDSVPSEVEGDFRKRAVQPGETRPWWVVVDSRGRLPPVLHFYRRMEYVRDIIVLVSGQTPGAYIRYLEEREYEYVVAGSGRVDLNAAFSTLAERYGIRTLVSDTGGRLDTALLESGLVDEISLIVAPVLSGEMATPLYRPGSHRTLPLLLKGCTPLGDGYVRLVYDVPH